MRQPPQFGSSQPPTHSTNAAVNSGSLDRFGIYVPPTSAQRSAVIAERVEAHNSAAVWQHVPIQQEVFA